jgi:uncharacterized membrane protein YdjX (TVP38/TMEM64 family)
MSAQARVLAGTALIVISLCGAAAAQCLGPAAILRLNPLIADIRHAGATGWLIFLAIQIAVAASGLIPASLIGVAAGLGYGTTVGFLLSAAGTLIGGCIAFLLGRSLMRPFVAKWVSRRPRLARLDEDISRQGWQLVCLLRISPTMPFAATSYALGLTRIRLLPYLMGSLASLPALLGYVVLGSMVESTLQPDLVMAGRPLHWGLVLVGAAATALLGLQIWRLIKGAGLAPKSIGLHGSLHAAE